MRRNEQAADTSEDVVEILQRHNDTSDCFDVKFCCLTTLIRLTRDGNVYVSVPCEG
jgi:hypothetical protein